MSARTLLVAKLARLIRLFGWCAQAFYEANSCGLGASVSGSSAGEPPFLSSSPPRRASTGGRDATSAAAAAAKSIVRSGDETRRSGVEQAQQGNALAKSRSFDNVSRQGD